MKKKIIQISKIACGSDDLFLIAGPCVIEDESTMMKTADKLKAVAASLNIKIIYKSSFQKDNRSNLAYYRGPGIKKGLDLLQRIKDEYAFPLLTDIHYPEQAKEVADVVDVVQIPAYLCMQTDLIVSAANTNKVINLKHGQFIAPENMKYPVVKCVDAGNDNIMLTERGYTFGYNDLIVDPRSFYQLNRLGYPVVFDVTHAIRKYGIPSASAKGGAREYLPVLARAGVASGVDGLFVEVHPNPEKALCDAASQLCVDHLEEFLKPLIEVHQLVVQYKNKSSFYS